MKVTGPSDLRALLLDFDGTLVDSLPALRRAYDAFLGEQGVEGSDAEFDELNGPTLIEIVTRLKQRHGLLPSEASLRVSYLAHIDRCAQQHTRLSPGAYELLSWAASQDLSVAIVTSAPRAMVEGFLHEQDPPLAVACIVAGTDVAAGKPDPACYRLALERLQLAPSEAVAVEDSAFGVRAARAAGIATFQVCPAGREEPGVEARVDNLSQLLQYLRARGPA